MNDCIKDVKYLIYFAATNNTINLAKQSDPLQKGY